MLIFIVLTITRKEPFFEQISFFIYYYFVSRTYLILKNSFIVKVSAILYINPNLLKNAFWCFEFGKVGNCHFCTTSSISFQSQSAPFLYFLHLEIYFVNWYLNGICTLKTNGWSHLGWILAKYFVHLKCS